MDVVRYTLRKNGGSFCRRNGCPRKCRNRNGRRGRNFLRSLKRRVGGRESECQRVPRHRCGDTGLRGDFKRFESSHGNAGEERLVRFAAVLEGSNKVCGCIQRGKAHLRRQAFISDAALQA
jgi:hypothetical protein